MQAELPNGSIRFRRLKPSGFFVSSRNSLAKSAYEIRLRTRVGAFEQNCADQESHSLLNHFFTRCDLSRLQKCFHQFAFATNRHARKFLEPFSKGHFGFIVEPVGQQTKLIGRNVSAFDSIQQMRKESGRKIAALDVRYG